MLTDLGAFLDPGVLRFREPGVLPCWTKRLRRGSEERGRDTGRTAEPRRRLRRHVLALPLRPQASLPQMSWNPDSALT